MARPARLELATLCLEGRRSIQLSYGRSLPNLSQTEVLRPEFLPLFLLAVFGTFGTTGA